MWILFLNPPDRGYRGPDPPQYNFFGVAKKGIESPFFFVGSMCISLSSSALCCPLCSAVLCVVLSSVQYCPLRCAVLCAVLSSALCCPVCSTVLCGVLWCAAPVLCCLLRRAALSLCSVVLRCLHGAETGQHNPEAARRSTKALHVKYQVQALFKRLHLDAYTYIYIYIHIHMSTCAHQHLYR